MRAAVLLVALAMLLGGAREGGAARIVENLYGAKLLDARSGWVVGAFGAVFKTSDGGKTWETQATPTLDYLFSVDFASESNGVVVGKAGVILATEDGGKTWTKRTSPTDNNLFSVVYASPSHVWAVGDWGAVLESTDGGKTWTDRSLADDVVLTSQAWLDDNTGFVAGEFGTIQKTTDGGKTFTKLDTGTDKTIFGVAFRSPQQGWAVGIDGLVMRTTDGGSTWQTQRGTLEAQPLEQLGFLEAMKNPGLYDIRFSGDFGYIVGDIGTILVSSDRGETWRKSQLPDEMSLFWLRGVSAAQGDRALVVGASGLAVAVEKDKVLLAADL